MDDPKKVSPRPDDKKPAGNIGGAKKDDPKLVKKQSDDDMFNLDDKKNTGGNTAKADPVKPAPKKPVDNTNEGSSH